MYKRQVQDIIKGAKPHKDVYQEELEAMRTRLWENDKVKTDLLNNLGVPKSALLPNEEVKYDLPEDDLQMKELEERRKSRAAKKAVLQGLRN